jgi:hypothetical protein
MKLLKILLVILASMVVMFSAGNSSLAAPLNQDVGTDESDTIQVVLVLDVSDSMKWPIINEELPAEFVAIMTQIQDINQNPPWTALEEQIEAILTDQEVVEFRAIYDHSVETLDQWFMENGYEETQAGFRQKMVDQLKELNCDTSFARPIITSITLAELDHWVGEACNATGISFDQHQALRDMVPYLGETFYTNAQEESTAAYSLFFEALEARNYNGLIAERDQIKTETNVDGLTLEMDQMILDYGILRKLDLAKLAARALISLSELDSVAERRISEIALVRFSTDAVLLERLTVDHDVIENKIIELEPLELTNIYAGLDTALVELENNGDPDQPIVVILLSDGHITTGLDSKQVLELIPPRAEEMDAVICTVGFGETEAHVDWPLLRGLADATDGEYLFAESGEELVNFFIACRQSLLGEVEQIGGIAKAGAVTPTDPLNVNRNVCEMSLALNYVSGDPVLEISDPEGIKVDENYPDFASQSQKNLQLYTFENPQFGDWDLAVRTEPGGEDVVYRIVITSQDCALQTPTPELPPTPNPEPTPMPVSGYIDYISPVIPLIGFVLLVMVIFILVENRRRN